MVPRACANWVALCCPYHKRGALREPRVPTLGLHAARPYACPRESWVPDAAYSRSSRIAKYGKLARATADVADVSDEMAWSHTSYYDACRVIADGVTSRDLARKRVKPAPPPPSAPLKIRAYPTPDKLPYYAAFEAALAGTLPQLK